MYKTREAGAVRDAMQRLSLDILKIRTSDEKANELLESQRRKLEQLEWVYRLIERMQTWPYDLRQRITSFISFVLGPLVAQLMEYGTTLLRIIK